MYNEKCEIEIEADKERREAPEENIKENAIEYRERGKDKENK